MYNQYESEYQTSESIGDSGHQSIDERSCQSVERLIAVSEDRYGRGRHELRAFLVACHQAAVSIETMSRQLGFDQATIRSELILGLETWKAAQRGSGEAHPSRGLAGMGVYRYSIDAQLVKSA